MKCSIFVSTVIDNGQRPVLPNSGKPVNLQVGHGTTAVATVGNFETGNPEEAGNQLDFFIDGEGLFMVQGPTGEINYTRDGSFKLSITESEKMLTTSDCYPVLDEAGTPITIDVDLSRLVVSQSSELSYIDEEGLTVPTVQTIGLVYFDNRNGLECVGRNLYRATQAAGNPVPAMDSTKKNLINQKFLEASNVNRRGNGQAYCYTEDIRHKIATSLEL